MIKLYSSDIKYLGAFTKYSNLKITDSLEAGYKTAQFKMPYLDLILEEEQKVIIDNYLYVIKEINMENKLYYDVYCRPYFGDLTDKYILSYNPAPSSFEDYLIYLLGNTSWKYIINNKVSGILSIPISNCSYFDAIETIKDAFGAELYYDTLNKTIIVNHNNNMNNYDISYTFNNSNLINCKRQSNTYDMITRLIPLGKNGLNISSINNGSIYLDNFDYTKEIIVGYYINDSITNINDLYSLARKELNKLAYPAITYTINIGNLNKPVKLGDNVRIIDTFKNIDTVRRINKMVIFPDNPEKNYMEVGSPKIMFNKLFNQSQFKQNYINNSFYIDIANINN